MTSSRVSWVLGAVFLVATACTPSDEELEAQFLAKKPELEALAQLVTTHQISLVNESETQPAQQPETEQSLKKLMKSAGVQTIAASEAGPIKFIVSAWGLAVSGVYRGFYFDPDARLLQKSPLGERVTFSKGSVRRIDAGWLVFRL